MTQTLPINPYIAGNAVGGERGFFGRQDILREVERVLSRPDDNAIVLYGQRRVGKTSILLQLWRRLPEAQFTPIYFDLMDKARLPLGQVLYELAITIANEAGFPVPDKAMFENDTNAFRQVILPQLYKAIGDDRRPVFLLDEFDVLDLKDEQQLNTSASTKTFLPYLRELMIAEKRLSFVFVVGRRMEELSIAFLSTFKAAATRQISVLTHEEATTLILQAEKNNALRFENAAVIRVLELTRGHPYLTQLTCQILFDRSHDLSSNTEVPLITSDMVELVIPKILEAGSNAFQWIWDGLPPAERIVFSAIAGKPNEGTIFSENDIMGTLQEAGIRILMRELNLAPQTLVDWQMLEQVDGGYRFFVELIRQWVSINKPLNKVKDELDRINPLADNLYQTAQGFYQQGNGEQAISQLIQALKSNPNHLKARLLLGTVLRDEGRLKEAVAEFETAYELDEREGRFDLLQALLQLGDVLEKETDDEALLVYERVLAISPREQTAQERKNNIWEKRGDLEIKSDNISAAIDAYEKSGATKKLSDAKAKKLALDLEEYARQAESYEDKEDWANALLLYDQLHALDGESAKWTLAQQRVRDEIWLSERYVEGAGYIQQKDWARAQKPLAEIINKRPDYKDAAQLLVTVNQRKRKSVISPREVRLLAYGAVAALTIALSGYLGIIQIQNIKNTNVTKTASAIRTQSVTSTPQAGPDMYDNFNNSLYDGFYDRAIWSFYYESPSRVSQKSGVLNIVQEDKANDQTAIIPTAYENIQLVEPTFFETKIKMDASNKTGWVFLWLDFNYSSKTAIASCRINDASEGYCEYVDNSNGVWSSRYETDYTSLNDGQFHTFRIEVDPDLMEFTYYLDNKNIGSHTPYDADKFNKSARYTPRIGVANWTSTSTNTLIGYFDDFRVGLVGK